MANKNLRPTEIENKSIAELKITTVNHTSSTRDIVPTATNLLVKCVRSISINTHKKVQPTPLALQKALVNLMVKIDHIRTWRRCSQAKRCADCSVPWMNKTMGAYLLSLTSSLPFGATLLPGAAPAVTNQYSVTLSTSYSRYKIVLPMRNFIWWMPENDSAQYCSPCQNGVPLAGRSK